MNCQNYFTSLPYVCRHRQKHWIKNIRLSRLLEADEVIGVCPCIVEHHINKGALDVIYCTVVEAGEGVIGVQGGWLHHAMSPLAGLPHQHPSLVHVLQPLGVRVRVCVVA